MPETPRDLAERLAGPHVDHVELREGTACSCGWKSPKQAKSWRAHAAKMRKRGQFTAERGALSCGPAERLASLAYGYAVAMHESIEAGKGAVGWKDAALVAAIEAAIREAEKRGRTAGVQAEFQSHEAEVLELTRTQEAEVHEARREGREEMRERAAQVALAPSGHYHVGSRLLEFWDGPKIAAAIRALPLDGPGEGETGKREGR